MSSAGSARQARRRSRVAVVSLVATASLVGTYLGALRPQAIYAATGRGVIEARNGLAPPLSGCEEVPGEKTYVDDDTKLQAAVASSVDDSIICITGTRYIQLSKTLVLDDTSITLMGDDSSIYLLPANGGGGTSLRHLEVNFSDSGDDSVIIRSLTFAGDYTVSSKGGAINFDGGADADEMFIYDSVFQNNISGGYGGAIYADDRVEIFSSVFTGNRAKKGGAIFSEDEMDVTGSLFTNNQAYSGGAIYMEERALDVDSSTFRSNRAVRDGSGDWGDGGAILAKDDVSLLYSEFSSNQAAYTGGAVNVTGEAEALLILSSAFTANVASSGASPSLSRGGAISASAKSVKISGFDGNETVFEENHADYAGGAIFLFPNTYIDIGMFFDDAGAAFLNNTAGQRGGALAIYDSLNNYIHGSTFVGNRVMSGDDTAAGGAISALNGKLEIEESYFANNYAVLGGGLAFTRDDTSTSRSLNVSGTAFVGNDAKIGGAGLYAQIPYTDNMKIKDSSFIANGDDTAPHTGGGIQAVGGVGITPTYEAFLYNSTISGNTATQQGAGAYWGMDLHPPTGMFPEPSIRQLSYLTVTDNTLRESSRGVDDGAGIFFSESVDQALVVNSVLWNNTVDDDTASDLGGPTSDDSVTLVTSSVTSLAAIKVKDDSYDPIFGNPLLGALGDNGGPRIGADGAYYLPTARPAWNSPVIVENDLTTRLPPGYDVDQLGAQRGSPAVLGAVLNSARPPSPTPVIPPSAPLSVSGVGGDGAATISWSAPASAGSFPVSTFQAVVSPGGQSCLVASSPCTITGLSNGTEYTVQVRALSGAGWGAFSGPSEPFTPEAPPVEKTMVITGSRGEVRGRPGIIISGSSTGMVGEQVAPWVKFPGQSGYAEGSARPTVDAQGDFTWQRRTGKKIYVYFRSVDSDVKSNRVIIRAR